MTIKYYLQPNPLTPDPDDQKARVNPNEVLEIPDIISEMLDGGSTVTEADALAVINLFFKTTKKLFQEVMLTCLWLISNLLLWVYLLPHWIIMNLQDTQLGHH